jgi:hypothetical protein
VWAETLIILRIVTISCVFSKGPFSSRRKDGFQRSKRVQKYGRTETGTPHGVSLLVVKLTQVKKRVAFHGMSFFFNS